MTRHPIRRISLAMFASLLVASVPSLSQTQRSGGGESQRIMQQYQQLAAEKTSLQAQLAQMKKDLDTAHTDLAAMKKERDAAKAHTGVPASTVTQLTAEKQTAEKNLEQYKQRMNELVTRFRETAVNLKEVEADRTKVKKDLSDSSAAFDKCASDNLSLYELNGEILSRYEHVGPFTKVSTAEPFTRITRARLENLVDEYRQKALELRAKKPVP